MLDTQTLLLTRPYVTRLYSTLSATEMTVDPEGPELSPAQIEAKVRRSRALWNKYANALQDTAVHALRLIEKKDAKGLFDYGGEIDMACENCHLEYWYPDDKKNRK